MANESYPMPSHQRMTLELLEDVRRNRDAAIVDQFRIDIAHDTARAGEVSVSTLLANEAEALSTRMATLARKQQKARRGIRRLFRFASPSVRLPAVQAQREYYGDPYELPRHYTETHVTPLLFATEPEPVEDIYVSQGWVFWAVRTARNGLSLAIYRATSDVETGHQVHAHTYEIRSMRGYSSVPNVLVTGEGFDEYSQGEAAALKRDRPKSYAKYQAGKLSGTKLKDFESRLVWRQWDYPSTLYDLPLGLTMQANRLLSRKK